MHAQTQNSDGVQGIQDIPIKTLSGQRVTLNDFLGKEPIYLKFWATWCMPCREQMPHLQKAYEQYGNHVQFIAINIGINDNLEAIKATQNEFGLTLPITIDETSELSKAFNLIGTPYHILIDKEGHIVHKGHEASEELDQKIKLLSVNSATSLKNIALDKNNTKDDITTNIDDTRPNALFFTSTWCDWYLKDSRPAMSSNCIRAQHAVNKLSEQYPQFNWIGVVTRLWTGETELKEYQDKYQVSHALYIDHSNALFLKHKVKDFPTLVVTNNGQEYFRTTDFSDPHPIIQALSAFDRAALMNSQ